MKKFSGDTLFRISIAAGYLFFAVALICRHTGAPEMAVGFLHGAACGLLLLAAVFRLPFFRKKAELMQADERLKRIREKAAERAYWITQGIFVVLEVTLMWLGDDLAVFLSLGAHALSLLPLFIFKITLRRKM